MNVCRFGTVMVLAHHNGYYGSYETLHMIILPCLVSVEPPSLGSTEIEMGLFLLVSLYQTPLERMCCPPTSPVDGMHCSPSHNTV